MGPEKIPATNIDILGDNSLNVTNGQTGTLTATVLPIDHTEGDVVWTSSDTNVVNVSKIGFYLGYLHSPSRRQCHHLRHRRRTNGHY